MRSHTQNALPIPCNVCTQAPRAANALASRSTRGRDVAAGGTPRCTGQEMGRRATGARASAVSRLSMLCSHAMQDAHAKQRLRSAAEHRCRGTVGGYVSQQLLHLVVHGCPSTWPCIHGCWWPLLGGARSTSVRALRGHGGQCPVAARSVQAAATRATATTTLACATAQLVRSAWRSHCSRGAAMHGMIIAAGGQCMAWSLRPRESRCSTWHTCPSALI